MIRHISIFAAIVAVLVSLSGICVAEPSFLGTDGNILTPDDTVLNVGDFNAAYHVLDLTDSVSVIGANFGLSEGLEVGIARFDPEAPGAPVETLLSAKYALLAETDRMPSVVIGAADITGEVDPDGSPGVYVVFGKNLTPAATSVAGRPMQPMRAYLGVGGGASIAASLLASTGSSLPKPS